MSRPYLVGYTDRLAAAPGDQVPVMLSSNEQLVAEIDLVRIDGGTSDGEIEEEVVASLGEISVETQRTFLGSCVRVPGVAGLRGTAPIMASALMMPTHPARHQAVLAQGPPSARWWLGLDSSGRPLLSVTESGRTIEVVGPHPVVAGVWYVLAGGSIPPTELVVAAIPLPEAPSWQVARSSSVRRSTAHAAGPPLSLVDAPLFMAAADDGASGWTDCFDGKLEAPAIGSEPLDETMMAELASTGGTSGAPLAAWDLGVGPSPARVRSVRVAATHGYPDTTALDGECLNTPMRAVTGHCWSGREQDFRLDSEAYGAIHFHSDDLDDCRWSPSAIISLPPDLPTAVYAVRARGNDQVAHAPIFVRPTEPTSDIALLMPTASYLAYANDHPASDGQTSQAVASSTPVLRPRDMLLHEHREWGLSCYDRHVDGSGVAYSTRLRPLLNMAPTHRYHVGAWQLPADLALVSWLRQQPIDVDILTDDDLDLEGGEMLAPYGTILTGTHPEYYTTKMLDAVEGWLDDGGRLIYLGGNGFYWRTAYDPDRPWIIEIRRGNAGSRAWESAPGEDHFAFTGERGGLWRHLGRAPQKLTGVGYAAQGFDLCGYYRLLPDGADPRAAFVFEGVESEVFGTAGTIGNGAAGQEVDRFDADLGSAADALVLATSEGLSDGYLRCVEELNFSVSGTSALHDPKVRADLVYHVRSGGGAVFATGSIAWSGSLGVDPRIDRITTNVINRFRDPTPLEW